MIRNRVDTYIVQQLASTGFVLCSPETMYRLRPDLWPTPREVWTDFDSDLRKILTERVAVIFRFEGGGLQGFGGAMTMLRLAERIYELHGLTLEVTAVSKDEFLAVDTPTTAPTTLMTRRGQEREKRLHELAAMEPPTHDCADRRDILAAREELARREVA